MYFMIRLLTTEIPRSGVTHTTTSTPTTSNIINIIVGNLMELVHKQTCSVLTEFKRI